MMRAPLGTKMYWDKWVGFTQEVIQEKFELLGLPSKNPSYDPQYAFDLTVQHMKLLLRCYSQGENVLNLKQYFSGLLDAWELSNQLAEELCAKENISKCRDWTFSLNDLNHYIFCFWLLGFALILNIPDEQWQRLLKLIGSEGEDALIDRVIASRSPEWKIGPKLCQDRPYTRLLTAIKAPKEQQAGLLYDFVDHWYLELNRRGKQQPYWYEYGNPDFAPFEGGLYFGRWCIEAAVVAKVFKIEDVFCLGHEHYPGDLLRPDEPTTHVVPEINAASLEQKRGFFSKLFRRK
ncbi:PoNe immunity protein domain-containing protein [Iodobacter arcticus]|uniref:PoNe immunity protein domain-containing protein n=1 Tax=Iodobacter arcticus TaxID=590593 RepID=A0ABW2R4C1_9NEIS